MVKRAYSKPTIQKIQLNPEQAVLAACSTGMPASSPGGNQCNPGPPGPSRCRKAKSGGDSTGAS